MIYRNGDVVRFARGSNEYVGEVTRITPSLRGLVVRVCVLLPDRVLRVDEEVIAPWHVSQKNVIRLERPVLTEKERAALVVLHGASWTVRGLREKGHEVSATTLRGLAARGLASGLSVGVGSVRALVWGLTDEGRRVARELRED